MNSPLQTLKPTSLALLTALALSACITPAPLGPRPAAGAAPTLAVPKPESSPTTDTSAVPGAAPFDIPPTATPGSNTCDKDSSQVAFAVYANPENRDIYYPGTELDLSMPLTDSTIRVGQTTRQNPAYRFSVPRASLSKGFEIGHAGYWPVSLDGADSLCARMFVALSPLSAEENQGKPVTMENKDLYSVDALPIFLGYDEATRFSYAVYKDKEAAAPLLSWLGENKFSDAKDGVAQALDQGKMIVLFSNNSSQMGDISSVLNSAIETSASLILGSHASSMVEYPRPQFPFGDIFKKRLEIKILPRVDKPVIFDAHGAGVGGSKSRLEVK